MAITVNGVLHPELCAQTSVAQLLIALGFGDEPVGMAVAINGAVVPRSQWVYEPVPADGVVEIVSATQGG